MQLNFLFFSLFFSCLCFNAFVRGAPHTRPPKGGGAAAAAAAAAAEAGFSPELLSQLLQSLTGDNSGEGSASMRAMLKGLAAELGSSGGPSSLKDSPLAGLFPEGLPSLQEMLGAFKEAPLGAAAAAGGSKGAPKGAPKGGSRKKGAPKEGAPGGPSLLEGLEGLMRLPGLQSAAEKIIKDSGVDGGLLESLRLLQQLQQQQHQQGGEVDIGELLSVFKTLSKTLESKGMHADELMQGFIGDPKLSPPPLKIPEALERLYKRNKAAPAAAAGAAGAAGETQEGGPPPVSLSQVRGFIEASPDALKEVSGGPTCSILVLLGGLAKAPLHAGIMLGLAEQYAARKETLRWHVVAGSHHAALSAAASLGFAPGINK